MTFITYGGRCSSDLRVQPGTAAPCLKKNTMNYAITRTIDNTDMASLKERTVEALKTEGFGVLTEIDMQATLKKKLNKDHLPHLILGACNPGYADKVVTLEPLISTMLPCNVTIRQLPDGKFQVAAIDPAAAMSGVDNPAVEPLAVEVRDALKRVIEKL